MFGLTISDSMLYEVTDIYKVNKSTQQLIRSTSSFEKDSNYVT